jgi:predicted amidophosphoribosyltransferase
MSELKSCPSCGLKVAGNVKFCPECGGRIPQQIQKNPAGTKDTNVHDSKQSASTTIADQLFKKYQDDIPWAEPDESSEGSRDQGAPGKQPVPPVIHPAPGSPGREHVSLCSSCGAAVEPGKKFCGKCGTPVSAAKPIATLTCSGCGATIETGKKFCGKCGTPVSAAKPIATLTCSGCGATIEAGKKFCGKCGTPVSAGGVATRPVSPATCPGCGILIVPGRKFCSKCGTKLP